MVLACARVRWFDDGAYAVSVADAARRRFTLIDGDNRAARVVHVDDDAWSEAWCGPVLVADGIAMTGIAVSFDGGELRREVEVSYPDGTRRHDTTRASGGEVERATHWSFPGGRSAEVRWTGWRERELTFTGADGAAARVLRTRYVEDSSRSTEVSGPNGSPLGSLLSSPSPGGRRGAAYDSDGSEITSWSSQRIAGGTVITSGRHDGTIEQTVVSDASPSGTSIQHMTINPDGSGSMDSSSTLVRRDGSTATVTTTLIQDAQGHSTETVEVRDDASGVSKTMTEGFNSLGEEYRSAKEVDGQGNESQTTITYHADESFTITTASKGADGQGTIDSQTYDAAGNEISPGQAANAAKQAEEQQAEEERGAEEEREREEGGGGQPVGGGSGSFPSEEGGDEGPPLGPGTFAESALGSLLGLGGGGPDGGEGNAGETAIDAVRGRLVGDVLSGGNGEAGWGDSTSDEAPGHPIFDQELDAPLLAANEDWGDLNNPHALATVVERVAGAGAGAVARSVTERIGS